MKTGGTPIITGYIRSYYLHLLINIDTYLLFLDINGLLSANRRSAFGGFSFFQPGRKDSRISF